MKVLDIITENKDPGITPEMEAVFQDYLKKNKLKVIENKVDDKELLSFMQKRRYNSAMIEAGFNAKYGWSVKFLKAIGFLVPLYDCYTRLRALNDMAKEERASGQMTHSVEWFKEQENYVVGGFFMTQIAGLLPGLLSGGLTTAVAGILSYAVRSTGKAGGVIMVIAGIASAAGIAALKTWLSSEAGMNWMKNTFLINWLMYGTGWFANMSLDWVRRQIKEYTGVDVGVVTPDIDKEKDDAINVDIDNPKQDPRLQNYKAIYRGMKGAEQDFPQMRDLN